MVFYFGEDIYGLKSPRDGAVKMEKSCIRKEEDIPGYRVPKITNGILREMSLDLFDEYTARHDAGPIRGWAETRTNLGGTL